MTDDVTYVLHLTSAQLMSGMWMSVICKGGHEIDLVNHSEHLYFTMQSAATSPKQVHECRRLDDKKY